MLGNDTYSDGKTIQIEDTPGKQVCVQSYDKMGNESEVECVELKVDTKHQNYHYQVN